MSRDGLRRAHGRDQAPNVIAEIVKPRDGQAPPFNVEDLRHSVDHHQLRAIVVGQQDRGSRNLGTTDRSTTDDEITVDFVNDPDGERIVTGEDGRVTIKIRNQGLNVIGALYDSPSDVPDKIDKIENMATLSFVLAPLPE